MAPYIEGSQLGVANVTIVATRLLSLIKLIMEPSTASLAVGDGDHVTIAPAIPGSTFMEATVFGHMTVGGSLSALDK